jgi:hypothetical protein
MKAAEARALMAELGLTAQVRAVAASMPPLSDEQIDKLRRIFNAPHAQRDGVTLTPSRFNDPPAVPPDRSDQ